MKRLLKQAWEWQKTQHVDMFRHHWRAYVRSLEKGAVGSRFYYLGLALFLNIQFYVTSQLTMIALRQKHAWFESAYWRTALFSNFFPVQFRIPEIIIWYYYSIQLTLGVAYELFRAGRAPAFMRIFTAEGLANFERKEDGEKFRKFYRNTARFITASSYVYYTTMVVVVVFSGYLEGCYHANPVFFVYWSLYLVLQGPSVTYVLIAIPGLLVASVYYLYLKQKFIQAEIAKLCTSSNRVRLYRGFERNAKRYVAVNSLLAHLNQFWDFYLWLYLTIFPMLISYIIYVIFKEPLNSTGWLIFYNVAAGSYINQLSFMVYHSTRISRHNRKIAKRMTQIYRSKLEARLTGEIRRHLHLQATMENIRLSKYSLRTINNNRIDTRTYPALLFKFAFIFFKLIANNTFTLEKSL